MPHHTGYWWKLYPAFSLPLTTGGCAVTQVRYYVVRSGLADTWLILRTCTAEVLVATMGELMHAGLADKSQGYVLYL